MSHDNGIRVRMTRRYLMMAALAAAAGGFAGVPEGLAATAAESYVARVGAGVLKAANAGSVASFRSLLRQNADIASIALFSLGPYRKQLHSSRRQEYYGLVEKYISGVFAAHSAKLRGHGLTVNSSREAADSVIVNSSFKAADGSNVSVTWRLIKRGGSYKVFDVNVQGIWLATTQKTNFISVLKKNDGSIDALITYLRQ